MRVKSWDFTKNVQHVGCKVNPCLGLAIPALITCHFITSKLHLKITYTMLKGEEVA